MCEITWLHLRSSNHTIEIWAGLSTTISDTDNPQWAHDGNFFFFQFFVSPRPYNQWSRMKLLTVWRVVPPLDPLRSPHRLLFYIDFSSHIISATLDLLSQSSPSDQRRLKPASECVESPKTMAGTRSIAAVMVCTVVLFATLGHAQVNNSLWPKTTDRLCSCFQIWSCRRILVEDLKFLWFY